MKNCSTVAEVISQIEWEGAISRGGTEYKLTFAECNLYSVARKAKGDLTGPMMNVNYLRKVWWVGCRACGVLGHGGACQQCQQCHRIWTGGGTHDPLTTTNQTEFSAQW